jgi:hypothetical protein
MDLNALLNPGTLALLIPILGMAWGILESWAKHRERMVMIEKGIDPNAYKLLNKGSAEDPAPPVRR